MEEEGERNTGVYLPKIGLSYGFYGVSVYPTISLLDTPTEDIPSSTCDFAFFWLFSIYFFLSY